MTRAQYMSPAHRSKLSAATAAYAARHPRKHTLATRQKIAAALRGRQRGPMSEAQKAVLRVKNKGRKMTPEARAKMSRSRFGGLTIAEHQVKQRLEREGCQVFHRGWPDFLVIDARGKIHCVEVKLSGKGKSARLSPDQQHMKGRLEECGIDVEVVIV